MPRNPVPVVSESDRKVLESWVRSTSVPAGLARRARIVLLAADGTGTNEIVDKTGSTRPTVTAWRNRYITEGLVGLDDRPKKGRAPEIDQIDVINATLQAPPEHLGITHWSSRILGKSTRHLQSHGCQDLETVGHQTVQTGDIQVLHRPGTGGQDP
jgi:hypothetical protein